MATPDFELKLDALTPGPLAGQLGRIPNLPGSPSVEGNPQVVADPNLGNCIAFNTAADLLRMGHVKLARGFTMTFWVNLSDVTNPHVLLSTIVGSGKQSGWEVKVQGGKTRCQVHCQVHFDQSEGIALDTYLTPDTWYHVTFRHTDENGYPTDAWCMEGINLAGSNSWGGSSNIGDDKGTGDLRIGKTFVGKITGLKIYRNVSLSDTDSAQEIISSYQLTRTKLHLNLDALKPGPLSAQVDKIPGLPEKPTLSGDPNVLIDPLMGPCLQFDYRNRGLGLGKLAQHFRLPSAFKCITVMFFLQTESDASLKTKTPHFILFNQSYYDGKNPQWAQALPADQGVITHAMVVKSKTPVVVGRWMHIAVTYELVADSSYGSGVDVTLYVNGTREAQKRLQQLECQWPAGLPFGIGVPSSAAFFSAGASFKGKIAQVYLDSQVLTQAEIQQHIDETAPHFKDINANIHLKLDHFNTNGEQVPNDVPWSLFPAAKVIGKPALVKDKAFGKSMRFHGGASSPTADQLKMQDNIPGSYRKEGKVGPFTIQAWIKPKKSPPKNSAPKFISTFYWHPGNQGWDKVSGWAVGLEADKLLFWYMAGEFGKRSIYTVDLTDEIPLDRWTHLTVCYDIVPPNNPLTFYMNGVPVLTKNDLHPIAWDDKAGGLTIGGSPFGDPIYDGEIAHFRLYNRRLDKDEILTGILKEYPYFDPFLLVLLLFERIIKKKTKRFVPNRSPIAPGEVEITGTPTLAVDHILGPHILFKGAADYVTLDKMAALFSAKKQHVSAFTLEAWVKPNSIAGETGCLSAQHESDHTGWAVKIGAQVQFVFGDKTAWHTLASKRPALAGHWTHLAVTCDGTTTSLYHNGHPAGTATEPFVWPGGAAEQPCRVGKFSGALARIRLYRKAYTQDEICQHIEADVPGYFEAPLMDLKLDRLVHLA